MNTTFVVTCLIGMALTLIGDRPLLRDRIRSNRGLYGIFMAGSILLFLCLLLGIRVPLPTNWITRAVAHPLKLYIDQMISHPM